MAKINSQQEIIVWAFPEKRVPAFGLALHGRGVRLVLDGGRAPGGPGSEIRMSVKTEWLQPYSVSKAELKRHLKGVNTTIFCRLEQQRTCKVPSPPTRYDPNELVNKIF